MSEPEVNREQLVTVLEQIADYSSPDDIRDHVREVVKALRSTGMIFLNGLPQQKMRESPPPG